ncbi:MAG: SdrD B-like domain-containing protein, partial [Gemmatimonas sp.]
DAALQRVKLDGTFQQNPEADVDALILLLSSGGDPRTANHVILYLDAKDRAAPNVTLYRYDPGLGLESYKETSNLLLSSATGSTTTADVLQLCATQTGSNLRLELTLSLGRVNNGANWTSLGVNPTEWEGMLFGSYAGVTMRHIDLATAAEYDSNGALTKFDFVESPATVGVFETDPSGASDVVTELCPTPPWVGIGNLVFADVNLNGVRDGTENGVRGASLRLFNAGKDGAVGGTGINADFQVGGPLVTSGTGAYSFTNLVPGRYYISMTPPPAHPATGGAVVTIDNRVNNDNNGSQPGGPGTEIRSPVILLMPGTEPLAAVDGDDAQIDSTVDFAVFSGITVGDTVWADSNNNGLRDSGSETTDGGLSGITLELLATGADGQIGGTGPNADTVVQTGLSDANGLYSLRTFTPGSYYVRFVPPGTHPLISGTTVTLDNGADNDNNGSQPGGSGTEVRSMVFALIAGQEPGSTGTGNVEGTIDFGLRTCPALVITPNPQPLPDAIKGSAYNAVFQATGGNGPYQFTLASGTLPNGFTLGTDGTLSTPEVIAVPGTYPVVIRATDAFQCSS